MASFTDTLYAKQVVEDREKLARYRSKKGLWGMLGGMLGMFLLPMLAPKIIPALGKAGTTLGKWAGTKAGTAIGAGLGSLGGSAIGQSLVKSPGVMYGDIAGIDSHLRESMYGQAGKNAFSAYQARSQEDMYNKLLNQSSDRLDSGPIGEVSDNLWGMAVDRKQYNNPFGFDITHINTPNQGALDLANKNRLLMDLKGWK
jgi:hypothetical protein